MTRAEMLKSDSDHLDRLPGNGHIQAQRSPGAMKVCIVGASGKLGQYMLQHALDRGYEVVGVCREESVDKLDTFKGRITIVSGIPHDQFWQQVAEESETPE